MKNAFSLIETFSCSLGIKWFSQKMNIIVDIQSLFCAEFKRKFQLNVT